MSHLKRHNAPSFWPIKRKGVVWSVKPSPGPYSLSQSIPLLILVRDVLKLADTAKEAKHIIKQGKVLVDKKARTDPRFPLGLMNVVEFPDAKTHLQLIMGKHGLEAKEIEPSEATQKICRIEDKKTVKNNVFQLNLHDGRNMLVDNNQYKPGDSLLIELPTQNILDHFKLEKSSPATVIGGKNIGSNGHIAEIHERKNLLEKNRIIVESGGRKIETLKKYILVTGSPGGKPDTKTEATKAKQKKPKAIEKS